MSLSDSVERFLAALGESDLAAADVELLRRLAYLLDENPFSEPEIYREYRFAIKAVREALGDDGVDEGIVELLERLGDSDVRDGKEPGS